MLKHYLKTFASRCTNPWKSIQLVKKSNLFKTLTSGSVNQKIFSATILVALMTALGKVISVAKELVVAWSLGVSDDLDAFFIALIIPSFFVTVIANSFNVSLIPTYIDVRERKGIEAAQKLFSGAIVFSFTLLALMSTMMVVSCPVFLPRIGQGFNEAKLNLTFNLLLIISPWLVFTGIITIIRGVLNAGERFALAAFSPTITPAITILLLVIKPSLGVYALALGLIIGAFLELVLLGMMLTRQGIYFLPKWSGFDEDLRQVIAQYIPMIAGACLMGSTTLVDQSMAAMLSPGSVSALNYGNKLIALPITIIVTGLGTAVFPYFSQMTADRDWKQIKNTIKKYLRLIFLFTIPFTIFLLIISETLVRIMFQRGAFTAEDTQIVSRIQSCYALQIPFYVAGVLLVRLISSLKGNHILMKAAIWNLMLNIVLNFLLLKWMGVAGIALSTSLVRLYSYTYVSYYSYKLLRKHFIH
ncbi:MAG: murein biosynthesis integral membrane protein MurJ [Crocosphaera sp.]